MKKIYILTIFPDVINSYVKVGVIKEAKKKKKAEVIALDLRKFADKGQVDDLAYGGHPGMVIKPEPVFRAYEYVSKGSSPFVIITEPWGRTLTQDLVEEISRHESIMIIAGRYEGVDERVKAITDLEVSVGDFILSGGELPALMIAESVVRLIPGVLGDPESLRRDSFRGKWLGCPAFTRPREFRGMKVPEVLTSGNHQLIELWQLYESIKRTLKWRPSSVPEKLTEVEKSMIESIIRGEEFDLWLQKNAKLLKISS